MIIAGPTASGKSALAVELAKRLNGAVISADSMQVYRGMDIGSAKVTAEEMQGIPHYLIDIIDPVEEWNVVRFQQEAKKAVSEILSQGKLPILALLYDIDFTQTDTNNALRRELQKIADTDGNQALHEYLEKVDPAAALQIHPNNVKRVIRAIEYAQQSGASIAQHNALQREKEPAFDAGYYVLTMDRDRLYRRIDERVDAMMQQGLVQEVDALQERWKDALTPESVSMQGLGYKQILQYRNGEYTLDEAVEQIKLQTRHFAKRQLTWFRREKGVTWIDRDQYDDTAALAQHIKELWKIR